MQLGPDYATPHPAPPPPTPPPRQAPILVEPGPLRALERALWRDTAFLAALGVMDYSLLVGVDREANELVVAIIDFIRWGAGRVAAAAAD